MISWLVRGSCAIALFAAGMLGALEKWSGPQPHAAPERHVGNSAKRALEVGIEQALLDRSTTPSHLLLLAKRLNELDPLHPLPFEVVLTLELEEESKARATKAASHALARDPRRVAPRLFLIQEAVSAGTLGDAMEQIDQLSRVWRPRLVDIVDTLIGLSADPSARDALLRKLEQEPAWGRQFASRLPVAAASPDFAFRVYQLYPDFQRKYLSEIIRAGRPDAAYLAWLQFQTSISPESLNEPYDNTFQGKEAAQPFNWVIDSRHAEFMPAGGLYVVYFGRGRPQIAMQVMALTPGVYRLTSMPRGTWTQADGGLEWIISCISGEQLSVVPILPSSRDDTSDRDTVRIPEENCNYQRLVLRGRPGEYPQTIRVELASVSLTSVDGAAE